jgi:hypothetical protein
MFLGYVISASAPWFSRKHDPRPRKKKEKKVGYRNHIRIDVELRKWGTKPRPSY